MSSRSSSDEAAVRPRNDLRLDRAFFGRRRELSELLDKLSRGRHVLLVGERGTGKTRLMEEAFDILSGRKHDLEASLRRAWRSRFSKYKKLFVSYSTPLSVCLKDTVAQLAANGDVDPVHIGEDGKVKGLITDLERITFDSMKGKNYMVFLDNVDRVTGSAQPFLEPLMEYAVVCGATTQVKNEIDLKKFWSSFSRIDLEPLPKAVCSRIVDHYCETYPIFAEDKTLYRNELIKAASGNPFHLKTMLWHATRQRYLELREIRRLREVDESKYFNLGPVYVFVLIFFTLSKILITGSGNKEFYIFLSVLGLLAYMTFRVFRRFFLFLPQKHT